VKSSSQVTTSLSFDVSFVVIVVLLISCLPLLLPIVLCVQIVEARRGGDSIGGLFGTKRCCSSFFGGILPLANKSDSLFSLPLLSKA